MSADPLDRLRAGLRREEAELLGDLAVARGLLPQGDWEAALAGADAVGALNALVGADRIAQLREEQRRLDLEALRPDSAPEEVLRARSDPARVVGRYVLVEPIGRGGASTVWKGWDGQLHRWVAVKIPRDPVPPAFRQWFLREGRVAASIHHPNVVAVHDAGEADGRLYLVMELVRGKPLDGSGGPRRSAEILRKVAGALEAIHQAGIVHRDLKPANVLVDDRGEPRVVDFGLARAEQLGATLSRTGAALGTPLYMAPEQVRGDGKAISPRTDVYGLGVILYELLGGRPPFDGPVPAVVFRLILEEDPPAIDQPGTPGDLVAISLRAMEKDPGRRYAGAAEFGADLDRFLAGVPIEARPSSVWSRTWRRLRRQSVARKVAAAALALALVAGAGLAVVTSRHRSTSDQLAEERLAAELSSIYIDLSVRTGMPMQALLDRWLAGRSEPGAAELQGIEKQVREVAARHPRSGMPRAWLGLARVFAGSEAEGVAELEAACAASPEDPFPHVFLARARLAGYAREANLGGTSFDLDEERLEIVAFRETPGMSKLRESAGIAVRRALAMPPWRHVTQGRELHAYAEAAEALERGDHAAVAERLAGLYDDPRLHAEARLLGGLALVQARRLEEAAEVWEGVGGSAWGKPWCLAGAARLQLAIGARARRQDARPALRRAIESFDEALRRAPGYYDAVSTRAIARMFLARFESEAGTDAGPEAGRAVGDADEACRLLPSFLQARTVRASILREAARLEQAWGRDGLALLERGLRDLEHSPGSLRAELWFSHAQAAAAAGRDPAESFRRAIADLDGDIAASPTAGALALRASCRAELGARAQDPRSDFALAEADLGEALRLEPGEPSVLGNRGYLRTMRAQYLASINEPFLQDLEAGLEDLTQAIARRESADLVFRRATAHYHYGLAEMAADRDPTKALDLAMADATRAIELNPRSWAQRIFRGDVQAQIAGAAPVTGRDAREHLALAAADFLEAQRLAPARFEAFNRRGAVLEAAGRFDEAAAEFEKSLGLRPDQPGIRERIAALRGPQ